MKVLLKLYAEFNLGDDLFLKIILERYPNVKFYIIAPEEYVSKFSNYKNLEISCAPKETSFISRLYYFILKKLFPETSRGIINKKILRSLGYKLIGCDMFVSIGGSIFMQLKKLPFYDDLEYNKIIVNNFRGRGIFFIGCNFGPYLSDDYLEEYRKIFNESTDVCFREKASKLLFLNNENVRYKPDVVFGLAVKSKQKIKKSVGFSVVSPRNNINPKLYIEKYAELITFYQSKEYEIYLFSFCKKEGDEETIDMIFDLLNSKKNVNKVFYKGNVDEFLDIYSKVEKVYCGRFHAMIISMLFGQQIYPVVYSKKMTNVLDDIGYIGRIIDINEFHKLNPNDVYEDIKSNSYNVEKEKINALHQFIVLDSYLFS